MLPRDGLQCANPLKGICAHVKFQIQLHKKEIQLHKKERSLCVGWALKNEIIEDNRSQELAFNQAVLEVLKLHFFLYIIHCIFYFM